MLCTARQHIWSHADSRLRGALFRMYSPTPTKYMTCAIPNSGAMTRARQPAPFRNAEGPSFRIILLLRQGGGASFIYMHKRGNYVSMSPAKYRSKGIPYAIHYSAVRFLTGTFVQRLQSGLHNWKKELNRYFQQSSAPILPSNSPDLTNGVKNVPSQGLTATAAVEPATQPERNAQ